MEISSLRKVTVIEFQRHFTLNPFLFSGITRENAKCRYDRVTYFIFEPVREQFGFRPGKPGCTITEEGYKLEISDLKRIVLPW